MNIKSLSDEEIRIMVAAMLGWKEVSITTALGGGQVTVGLTPPPSKPLLKKIPNWPGKLFDAFSLINNMREKGVISTLVIDQTYSCHFGQPATNWRMTKISKATSYTLPRAICEAWILWEVNYGNKDK